MRKWTTKMMSGLLVAALSFNLYGTDVVQTVEPQVGVTLELEEYVEEETVTEEQAQEIASDEKNKEVGDRLQKALESFETAEMKNLYPELKKREKKKWLELIHANQYFEASEGIQFQPVGLYEIGDNQYYLLGWGAAAHDSLKLAEQWSEAQKAAHQMEGIFQLVLTQEEGNYFATYASYPSETILTSEEVALYKKVEQEASNVAIEYNKVSKLGGLEEYVGYLEEAIGELAEETINDNAKGEVTQYVQYAIEELASESVETQANTVEIKPDLLTQMKESLAHAQQEFNQLLDEKEIGFNKSLNTVLKLQTEAINFKEPIFIQLPKSFEDLGEVTGLRILLDDQGYVYIDAKDFEALEGMKIKIERLKDRKTYEITFLTGNEEVLDQLEQSLTFALPAKDEFTTVLAQYGEESQNWGGQFDPASKTIAFATKYSGQYKIVDNNVKIKDIGMLPSRQQSAIKFMVSKGYLTLENDHFYPKASFTRYEFAEALVKMFFALDTSLTTTFKDVPKESAYYPYVASGETYEIIKGYADETFRGEVKIPKEQVLSLCARTIADQKGYVYPSHLQEYINFADNENIAPWAEKDIALAVQSGLITGGGKLEPKDEITKAESAEILYQLFMLLYETTPGEIVDIPLETKTYSIIGVILLALLVILAIRRFIKRNKVVLTLLVCTLAIIITLIIGFKGGF